MGGWCIAGDGEGAAALARHTLRFAAGGLRGRLPVGGLLLFHGVSALGLAADVFHRRRASPAGFVCSLWCQGIGSVAENKSRKLAWIGPGNCVELETLPLPDCTDDDDEFRLTRHARYVSDFSKGATWVFAAAGSHYCGHLQSRCTHRRYHFWLAVRPVRAAAGDDDGVVAGDRRYSPLGVCAEHGLAGVWGVPDAIHGPGGMGCDSGAYHRAFT